MAARLSSRVRWAAPWILATTVVVLAMGLAAPAHAQAIPLVGDLLPDIPGPADMAREIIQFFLKTFFGIEAKVTTRVVEFLIAHPMLTDPGRYPDVTRLRSYVSSGSWALLTLVFTASALRYWAAGFTSASSYEALSALGRAIAAVGALLVYPKVCEYALVATNLLTHALIDAPGVQSGLTKMLGAALVLNVSTLGIGAIASVVAVIGLVILAITKIVLTTVLGVLLVSAPLAIVFWPLPETAWLARTWLQTFFAIALWPVVWALCFALFAVMGNEAFNLKGSFGDKLIKPWVTVAALFVAYKAPTMLARQAMMAGLVPSVGAWGARSTTQAVAIGRMGGRGGGGGGAAGGGGGGGGAAGGAAGWSGSAAGGAASTATSTAAKAAAAA